MTTKTVTLTIVLTAPFSATEDEIQTEAVLGIESGALHVEFISVANGVTNAARELGGEPLDALETESNGCAECARSFGPHYRGQCDHV
jgi:hypothetical protein